MNIEKLTELTNRKFHIKTFDELPSTNNYCMQLGKKGETDTIILAKTQTRGKGRLGRIFYSPSGTGLYMSLLFNLNIESQDIKFITVAAAVAAARAIEKHIKDKPLIKWVNDIYVKDKKVCGILCETSFVNSKPAFFVLGIGINLTHPENGFDKSIINTASSLFEQMPEDADTTIAADFINIFTDYCKNIDKKEFLGEYKNRSYLDGCLVDFEQDGKNKTALVLGIDDDAAIILKDENNTVFHISAGEVSLKKRN